jgi:hypothetical protein
MSPTPLATWISLGIAILSFVLAVTSLVVLVYQFRQSGGRVVATLEPCSQLVGQREKDGTVNKYVRMDGLLLTARNIGRLEAHVTDLGLALPNTVAKMWPAARRSGAAPPQPGHSGLSENADTFRLSIQGIDYELPRRLAPGESASWWFPLEYYKKETVNAGIGLPVVRGAIVTGTGKRVVSETCVDLAEPETSFSASQGSTQAARLSKRRQARPRIEKIMILNVIAPPLTADEGDNVSKAMTEQQSDPRE